MSLVRNNRRFTTVELLAVASLLVALMLLALPVYHSSKQAVRVETGARMVGSELRRARHYAIAQGRYVAVLMPTAQAANSGGVDDRRFKASSARAVVLTGPPVFDADRKAWAGEFDSYMPNSQWLYLPSGTYIGYSETNGAQGNSATSCRSNMVDGTPFPGTHSPNAVDHIRAVIFTPDGRAVAACQGAGSSALDTQVVVLGGLLKDDNTLWPVTNASKPMHLTVRHFSGKVSYHE
jgi:Tfp pilus assembly protein FimT